MLPCCGGLNSAAAAIQQAAHSKGNVYKVFIEQAAQLGLSGSLSFLDLTGQNFVIQAFSQPAELAAWQKQLTGITPEGFSFPIQQVDVFYKILCSSKSVFLADNTQVIAQLVSGLPDHVREQLVGEYGQKASIFVPLHTGGSVSGVFNLFGPGLSAEDLPAVEAFSNHLSIALENAGLFEEQGKRAAELEAVRVASLSLTSSLDLTQVLNAILQHTIRIMPDIDESQIYLYATGTTNKLTFAAAFRSDGASYRPVHEPRPDGLTYSVARQGETIVIPDKSTHPLFLQAPYSRTGAIIGLPLKFGGQVLGVMNISYPQPRRFSPHELHLLELLGDQAAIAIENARLFQNAATERRHLSLLYDLSREMIYSLDPDYILNRAVSMTCAALGGTIGEAFTYRLQDRTICARAIYGRPEQYLAELNRKHILRPGIGLVGWVAESLQPLYIDDVSLEPRWAPIPGLDDGIASALAAPILAGDELLGIFMILSEEKAAFTPDHIELITAIGQEVGLALSNAQHYQETRRRLAELTLIQNLTRTFSQRLEPQVLLEEVAARLGDEVGYAHVGIYLVEEPYLVLKACFGPAPEKVRCSLQAGTIGMVARTGEIALVPNEYADPDRQGSNPENVPELAVPICRNDRVIGVIDIKSEQLRSSGGQDYDLLKVLASQISVALENALLYDQIKQHAEKLEQTVEQRTAELAELYQLSQEIGFRLSYADLLGLLLRRTRNAIRGQVAIGCLSAAPCSAISVETSLPLSSLALSDIRVYVNDLLARYLELPQASLVYEVRNAEGEEWIDSHTIRQLSSFIHAPIWLGPRLAGILIVASEAPGIFGPEQQRLLNTFASQAANAAQRLETILAAQQEHLERLMQNIPVGTVLLDDSFNILLANPLGHEILTALMAEQDQGGVIKLSPTILQELSDHLNDPLPVAIEMEGPPRRVFEAQIRPIENEERRWVLTVRDVTQERENQDRIQSQERLATVGQLAAGIAHDFNNIMAAILVYADLLHSDPQIPAPSREKLKIIEQQVHRAASLIRQILDFSRRSIMEPSQLDLLPFIKELDKLLGRVLPETIRLELIYPPGRYLINADPTRLQQVFMNLALNARDAMPDGGTLRFEVNKILLAPGQIPPISDMPAGEWVTISVSDTGHGIAPEVRQHIFEPFFTTKPVGQGTGLGLAQVYGIIRHHDGFIDVQSVNGAGARFTIYLPAMQEGAREDRLTQIEARFSGHGETILVVEDDPATREALQALLEANEFNVLTAKDGIEALKCFEDQHEQIELVISDVVMPGLGGVDLYHQLKVSWPEARMLFVTGHPLDEHNQALLERGNVHWLQKPFSVREFNQAVQLLLQMKLSPAD